MNNWVISCLSIFFSILWFISWFFCGTIILLVISRHHLKATSILLAVYGFSWLIIFFLVRELVSKAVSIIYNIFVKNIHLSKFRLNFEVMRFRSIERIINIERSINE